MDEYTVTNLNNMIKNMVTSNLPNTINVTGEISNCKYANGNIFLTLKDKQSSIGAIAWNYEKYIKEDFEDGDTVSITCKVTYYSKGNVSLNIKSISKIGEVNAYECMKQECVKRGYFDKPKKAIPNNIKIIGIATAPEGAAIQDILHILRENNFRGKVVICRSIVQGHQCPSSLINAMNYLEDWSENNEKIDLLLVTRGGGSYDDLLGFSDINVLERLLKCNVFTISAVGHETDTMLSDYVADMRAATPSIAARFIVDTQKMQMTKMLADVDRLSDDIKNKILTKINTLDTILDTTLQQIQQPSSKYLAKISECEKYGNIILDKINLRMLYNDALLCELTDNITNNDATAVLNAGYAVVLKNGRICKSIENLQVNQKLKIKLQDGYVDVLINKITEDE